VLVVCTEAFRRCEKDCQIRNSARASYRPIARGHAVDGGNLTTHVDRRRRRIDTARSWVTCHSRQAVHDSSSMAINIVNDVQ